MGKCSARCWRAARALVPSSLLLLAALQPVFNTAIANDQNQFIPDDTLFYMGTGRGVAIADILALAPGIGIPESLREEMVEGNRFLDVMADFYQEPEKFFDTWGLDKNVRFSLYTTGISPTLRVAVTDSEAFQLALDEFEKKRGLSAKVSEREDVKVRLYSLGQFQDSATSGLSGNSSAQPDESSSNESEGSSTPMAKAGEAGVLVAIDGQDVILSLVFDASDSQAIDATIGVSKPEKSIAQSGELKAMRKKWGYGDELAAFVDVEQIAETFTGTESTGSEQLTRLATTTSRAESMLREIRGETCKSEIDQMAASWPMLVSGYRTFAITDEEVEFDGHAAAVIRHELLRDTLKLFRGVVPVSQSGNRPMISIGLGLTVDHLAQAVGQISQLLSSVSYRCSVLVPFNRLAGTDLSSASMGVVMFGGLARGVRGLSFNMFDVDVDAAGENGPLRSVDSAVAVSVEDPAQLLQTLKMMPQLGKLADLPLDGTEISLNSILPLPVPDGIELKAAVKGKNIVFYSGEMGTEFTNRLGGEDVEGFLHSAVDTASIFEKVESVFEALGRDVDDAKDLLSMLKAYPRGVLDYSVDFTDEGIEVQSGGTFTPNQSGQ